MRSVGRTRQIWLRREELGSSPAKAGLGALIGVELIGRHPNQTRMLVAHEPPRANRKRPTMAAALWCSNHTYGGQPVVPIPVFHSASAYRCERFVFCSRRPVRRRHGTKLAQD